MPVFDIDPGQSPEAAGTLSFYKQGSSPDTGFQVTTEGEILSGSFGGDTSFDEDVSVSGALSVGGYLQAASGQSDGVWNIWSGTANALNIGTAGGGIAVKEGTDARSGVATLVAGTVTVENTSVTDDTRIQLTAQDAGAAPGALYVSARVAGESFTITSTSGTDTSQVAYFLVEPAA